MASLQELAPYTDHMDIAHENVPFGLFIPFLEPGVPSLLHEPSSLPSSSLSSSRADNVIHRLYVLLRPVFPLEPTFECRDYDAHMA